MKLVHSLVSLVVLPMLAGPALANPRRVCNTCAPPVQFYKAPPQVIYRDRLKLKKVYVPQPFVVPQPVYIREQVSYLATLLTSPTYNVNTHITTPPPTQQVGLQVGLQQQAYTAQQAYGATYGAAQAPGQLQAPPHCPPPGQPQPQPQQHAALTMEQRMERMETAVAKLCDTFAGNGGNGGNGNGHEKGDGHVPIQEGVIKPPAFFGTVCAQCHNTTTGATLGGGYAMWDRGTFTGLTKRDLRAHERHAAAASMPPPKGPLNPNGIPALTAPQLQEWKEWLKKQQQAALRQE